MTEYRFGPVLDADGTTFRVWAPSAKEAGLVLPDRPTIPMQRDQDGFFSTKVAGCGQGQRYKFKIGNLEVPDLASRQQDGDTSGWSVVRAPLLPSGNRAQRAWHESVICEVHVGTATPEGTFAALTEKLEHFRDAGFTVLEIMPINETPGRRNWGYDSPLVFAPESAYGTPEELRALVDRAHALGLSLVLDVVYNHFGDVDNFAERYLPEWFDADVTTPWGPGIDFSQPLVRQFYYENACMWLTEYDFDGLRFDSVHEMKSDGRERFLTGLAQACRAANPDAKLIVENAENSASLLERDGQRPVRFTAQWNDDMHHVLTFLVTGEAKKLGYDDPAKDPYADFAKALTQGFVEDGEAGDGEQQGPAGRLPPDSFVTYLENHDQIGNRVDGKRLSERISPNRLDFCNFVKAFAPQIPLCFMGDEANLSSPFFYFIDMEEADANRKADDRYTQMRESFNEDVRDGELPDPNDPKTFEASKLRWDQLERDERRAALVRFRQLIRLRREMLWPLAATECLDARSVRQGNCLIVNWQFRAGTLSMALNPTDAPHDIACLICASPVFTGDYSQQGEVLRLGAWSAVAWVNEAPAG